MACAWAIGRGREAARDRQQRQRRATDDQRPEPRQRSRGGRSPREAARLALDEVRRSPSCRSPGVAVLLQTFLHRRNPEPRRLEEALDVLARVDETLGDAARRARRSTPHTAASRPDTRGRARSTPRRGAHRAPRARRRRGAPSARRRSRARGASAASRSATRLRTTGSSVLQTGQVGETKKSRVRRPPRRRRRCERPPAEVGERERRGGLADARPAGHHQRSHRKDALVQHADLPHQRHHDRRERDDRDPEEDVRDEERCRSLRPLSASCVDRHRATRRRGDAPSSRRTPRPRACRASVSQSTHSNVAAVTGARVASAPTASSRLRATSHSLIGCRPPGPPQPQSIVRRPRRRLTAIAAA